MSEYVLLYRNTAEARLEAHSPERAQETMKQWRAWFDELGRQGHLKALGQPLEHAGKVVAGKKKTVTDGPFAETKDIIGGYSIIEASNLDEAARLASGCPIMDVGGSVEVRPVLQMNV
jgi:hypothetical protein